MNENAPASEDIRVRAALVLTDYTPSNAIGNEAVQALAAEGLLADPSIDWGYLNARQEITDLRARVEKALEIGSNKSLSMGTRLAHIHNALNGVEES